MATGKEIISVAAGEIGYHEGKSKDNKYGKWFGLNNVAWCMEFVGWVYNQCGIRGPKLGLTYEEGGTPSCGALLQWYKKNQPDCIAKYPIPGCVVIFDFPKTKYSTDHTGIFVEKTLTTITTIDGNTTNNSGSDSNGGWVERRTRKLSYANPVYIVPHELEAEMKRYQTIEEINAECPWATATVQKLMKKSLLNGDGKGLDLTRDMLRLLVINDRAGIYD